MAEKMNFYHKKRKSTTHQKTGSNLKKLVNLIDNPYGGQKKKNGYFSKRDSSVDQTGI